MWKKVARKLVISSKRNSTCKLSKCSNVQFPSHLPLSFSNCSFKKSPTSQLLFPQQAPYTLIIMGSFDQNVIVMRHGDRRDNFDPMWITTADRPWDPPLVEKGRSRAFQTGLRLRSELGFPIHRVFVSPFLRCVQTASQVVSALCAVDYGGSTTGRVQFDSSTIKVSVEYGLSEMLNREAIRPESAPKDGDFRFNISEIEALLPPGTVDDSVERIYPEMPQWEETVSDSRNRYEHVIQALADKYPSENLLLVTHGEGVGISVSNFIKGAVVYSVNYCAYSHARRLITIEEDNSFTTEGFKMLTTSDQTSIGYHTSNSLI